MLNQSLVDRTCEWRMITPSLPGDAVNGIMTNLVNGHALVKSGKTLGKDYIITLPGFMASIIGTLRKETFLSAMICIHHRPLVIFGKFSFVKGNYHPLNDCLFCDRAL